MRMNIPSSFVFCVLVTSLSACEGKKSSSDDNQAVVPVAAETANNPNTDVVKPVELNPVEGAVVPHVDDKDPPAEITNTGENEIEKLPPDSDADAVKAAFDQISKEDFLADLKARLKSRGSDTETYELPSKLGKDVRVTWELSGTLKGKIDEKGVLTMERPGFDLEKDGGRGFEILSLEVQVVRGDVRGEPQEVTLEVYRKNPEPEVAVTLAYRAIHQLMQKKTDAQQASVPFPTDYFNDGYIRLRFESSDPSVVTPEGIVTRPNDNKEVLISLFLSLDGGEFKKLGAPWTLRFKGLQI